MLLAVTAACMATASATGRPLWAAGLGAGLSLGYWALEALAWRRAQSATFNGAVAAALGGAALRLVAVLVCLVLVGVLARDAFATVAVCFLVAFTVYLGVRLAAFSGPQAGAPQAGPR